MSTPTTQRIAAALAVLALLGTAAEGRARTDNGSAADTPAVFVPGEVTALTLAQSGGPSLSEAIDRVRRKYPNGRIIDAKTIRRGNREVHEIKVLTGDNKVRTERINGQRLNNRS